MTTVAVLAFCLMWCVTSIFYQSVIRRFGTDSTRFELFAIRDELREKAIAGRLDKNSFAFQYLETMLNCMVHFCGEYSVYHVIESRLRTDVRTNNLDYERFAIEASSELRELEERAMNRMMFSLIINSPGWILFSGMACLVMTIARGQYEFWLSQQNRVVWRDRQAMA